MSAVLVTLAALKAELAFARLMDDHARAEAAVKAIDQLERAR